MGAYSPQRTILSVCAVPAPFLILRAQLLSPKMRPTGRVYYLWAVLVDPDADSQLQPAERDDNRH